VYYHLVGLLNTVDVFTQNITPYFGNMDVMKSISFKYADDEERDINENKIMKINENGEKLKFESHENLQSEQRILNSQICSI
jgi:hypothetical protein